MGRSFTDADSEKVVAAKIASVMAESLNRFIVIENQFKFLHCKDTKIFRYNKRIQVLVCILLKV